MMRDHAQLAGMTLRFTAACALAAAGPSQTCATPDPVSIPPMVGYIWQTMTTRDGLPDDRIGTIRIVDDSIWVGTDRGLAVLTGGVWKTWNHVDRSKRTPLPPVSAIDIDRRTGDLWLGTRGAGLLRLSGGRFDRFDQMNSGLAGDFVFALAVVDGRVWAATNGGVSVYDPIPREWTLYLERRTDSPETPITDLRPDRAGLSLYATAWCAGVRRFGTRTGRLDSVSFAPSTRAVDHDDSAKAIGAALAVDCSAGVLWCATPRRLYRRDVDGTWAFRPIPADVTRGSFVRCLAARSTSQAWLGTDGGLLVLANWSSNTWARYGARKPDASPRAAVGRDGVVAEHVPIPTLPDPRVHCIAFQGDDAWIGTAAGLARARLRSPGRGVESDRIEPRRLAQDPRPPVWAPSNRQPPATPVAIGILAPVARTIRLPGPPAPKSGGVDVGAAQLAVREANAERRGGGGIRFKVLLDDSGYARYGWTLPEDVLARLSSKSDVCAILGCLPPSRRYAAAAAVRTEVPILNTTTAPAGIDESLHPWIFRCPGDNPTRLEAALAYLVDEAGMTRPAVLRTPGQSARAHLDAAARLARKRGCPPVVDVAYDSDSDDLNDVLQTIRESDADVVLTWCDARTAAVIVGSMRKIGMRQCFVGNDRIVSEDFVRLVGKEAGTVLAVMSCAASEDREVRAVFAERYASLYRRPPAAGAFRSFDAAQHLIRAIRLAGNERDAIRRVLRELSDAAVARLDHGRWQFFPAGGE